jgi:hypothetical protein
MSRPLILWLVGMVSVFAGQRLYAGHDTPSAVLSLGGLALVLVAIGLAAKERKSAADDGAVAASSFTLRSSTIGLGAVGIYALTTDRGVAALGLGEDAANTLAVVAGATWPILWACSAIVLLAVDHARRASPRLIPLARVNQAHDTAMLVGLALALVFPVNYLAKEHNHRFDLTYFRTATAGDATQSLVENLTSPVTVHLFFAPASDVAEELMAYFGPLEGPKLTVKLLDQAADPNLAKEMKVRDNGYVAVTGLAPAGEDSEEDSEKDDDGDAGKSVTKSFKVGTDLDAAKRKLKTLDEDFHKVLVEVAKGSRIAYLTTGHGEFSTKGGDSADVKLANLKKLLKALSFKVKTLGLKEGLGDAVPDDADLVMVIAPEAPFLPSEAETLTRYLDQGGSLFVALEPKTGSSDLVDFEKADPLDDVLAGMGIKAGEGVLASEASFYMETRRPRLQDRTNVFTTRFSSHASTTTLSTYARRGAKLILPTSGHLEEIEGFSGKVTITARSLPDNWADLDGDLLLGDNESKKVRPIAAASSGGSEADGGEWRGIVIADATALSDRWLPNPGNQLYVYDAVSWLLGEEGSGGTIESEEDVKIQHTRDDQVAWFYGTIAGVPFLVFIAGALRIRRRKTGGAA